MCIEFIHRDYTDSRTDREMELMLLLGRLSYKNVSTQAWLLLFYSYLFFILNPTKDFIPPSLYSMSS